VQDYLFVSFFLGHHRGEDARRLLDDCGLLELATANRANRHAWLGDHHTGVYLRLPVQDPRLPLLLDRLRTEGVEPGTRIDREYTADELDAAAWLVLRVATAGLWGGVDYGQTYDFREACQTCGAGAVPIPPLVAELGAMGKKDMDHLVYEGHLIVSLRVVEGLAHMTGIQPTPVKSPRRAPDSRFEWLRIPNVLPQMHASTTGYEAVSLCPVCGRGGHYRDAHAPEAPMYAAMPQNATDFNQTFEYYGDWEHARTKSHVRPVGGGPGVVVSQRGRQALKELGVRRLVWVPITTLE
jgi:hypothetical protein